MKNCFVAQSGGPTVAINASLAGAINGVLASNIYDVIYGSVNGIMGIIDDNVINLTESVAGSDVLMKRLTCTPAMYLGSCRYKLPSYKDDVSVYETIFQRFEQYNIGAFFYIGGNDSMDTVLKLSEYAESIGSDIRIIGIPSYFLYLIKTIVIFLAENKMDFLMYPAKCTSRVLRPPQAEQLKKAQ